ncbi:MAG: Mn transporter [Chloroflexi bacterium 13_1_40CM_2_70_6]|nr:MAG: Mn transporter [Chloroflexi bacterium 13_1_40CM_2_70_6]OLE76132.1 MAG: Mn transporter [Chloroflexi bacterium 13_1_20CM_2_70_9]
MATVDRLRTGTIKRRLLRFLVIVGPGIVTAQAGNDAGGIATYSSVGAAYGYSLLWMMVVITLSLGIVQEMCARMGAVTGKGLAELIRERFGIRWTLVAMLTVLVANGGVVVSEFAGAAAALELLGVQRIVTVIAVAGFVLWLVARGSYRVAERAFLAISLVFLAYPVTAFLAGPPWGEVLRETALPSFRLEGPYLFLFVATVGTTITPYMQLFAQSATVDKGVTVQELGAARADAYIGAVFSNLVAYFIIVVTGTILYPQGTTVQTAADAARALTPLAGERAGLLFAIGLFGASVLAAAVLPLATSYTICGALGWERRLGTRFSDAHQFYSIIAFLVVMGAAITLLPVPLIPLIVGAQVLNGFLLPVILIFILRLVNDRSLMGEHVNGPVYNVLAWGTTVFIGTLSLILLGVTFLGLGG